MGENRLRCFGLKKADTNRRSSPAIARAIRRPASEAASLMRDEKWFREQRAIRSEESDLPVRPSAVRANNEETKKSNLHLTPMAS